MSSEKLKAFVDKSRKKRSGFKLPENLQRMADSRIFLPDLESEVYVGIATGKIS